MARTHYTYVAYAETGAVLYVGCTYRPRERLWQHACRAPWWPEKSRVEIDGPFSHRAALDREQELIWTLGPIYNAVHPRDFRWFGLEDDGVTPLFRGGRAA